MFLILSGRAEAQMSPEFENHQGEHGTVWTRKGFAPK